jgi:hypothetical protein
MEVGPLQEQPGLALRTDQRMCLGGKAADQPATT